MTTTAPPSATARATLTFGSVGFAGLLVATAVISACTSADTAPVSAGADAAEDTSLGEAVDAAPETSAPDPSALDVSDEVAVNDAASSFDVDHHEVTGEDRDATSPLDVTASPEDVVSPDDTSRPTDAGCAQELDECPPGDPRSPTDLDGDGCPDRCCFVECPTDFVASDFDGDGCGDSCGDKPCSAPSDCALYLCAFAAGSCEAPSGVCSNFACVDDGPVCGCDGLTYESGCEANGAGVPVATSGACAPPE